MWNQGETMSADSSDSGLLDIVYEPITSRFSYGMFGNFQIIIDTETGFFNATKLCATGEKRFDNWLRNKHSIDYIAYLKKTVQEEILFLIENETGDAANTVKGTYVSRHLITDIACWISIPFAFKVNQIVTDYCVQEFKTQCETLQMKVAQYDQAKEDISPKTSDPRKRQLFVLVETHGVYPYYAIRCQRKAKTTQMKKLKLKYPQMTEIFEIGYDPNSMNLFNRVKEQIKNITTFCNGMSLLNGYSIDELIHDIKRIANEKY